MTWWPTFYILYENYTRNHIHRGKAVYMWIFSDLAFTLKIVVIYENYQQHWYQNCAALRWEQLTSKSLLFMG